jgi:hypothetical protein
MIACPSISGPGFFASTFDSVANRNLGIDVAYSYKPSCISRIGLDQLDHGGVSSWRRDQVTGARRNQYSVYSTENEGESVQARP